jgi:hypothetical protein
MPHERAYHRRLQHARQPRQQHAKQRRLLPARARLQREQARAQRDLQALAQALRDVGLSETLAPEVEWRLPRVGKLRGTIFGGMFPTLLGCRTAHELPRVRLWDKHLPGQMLGALPKQKWVRQLPHRGQDLWAILWHQVADQSPATPSLWQWTWVGDDRVCTTYGQPWGLVGTWDSGQAHRVRRGIDGLLLVVIGEGQLVMPVDFTVRRPDPGGLAGPAATNGGGCQ